MDVQCTHVESFYLKGKDILDVKVCYITLISNTPPPLAGGTVMACHWVFFITHMTFFSFTGSKEKQRHYSDARLEQTATIVLV